jgi:hypothetical protein
MGPLMTLIALHELSDDGRESRLRAFEQLSTRHAQQFGMTGLLLHKHSVMLSWVEVVETGDCNLKIFFESSPMYKSLEVIDYGEISQRIFKQWRFVDLDLFPEFAHWDSDFTDVVKRPWNAVPLAMMVAKCLSPDIFSSSKNLDTAIAL